MPLFDIVIVGAGIAGASLAWRMAPYAKVLVLEQENQPGYHATGRSAAMFMESYGTPNIRALTRASRTFYESPPNGFAAQPILHERGVLYVAAPGEQDLLAFVWRELNTQTNNVRRLDVPSCVEMVPCLNPQRLIGGIGEPDAMDIDVDALLQGFIRGAKHAGAQILCGAGLIKATQTNGAWQLTLSNGETMRTRTIVNAAGAWADQIASLCGVQVVGLEPRRRSAFTFAPPANTDTSAWPAVVGISENFYFKPDAGQLLGSPANADPAVPHDVVAEELDVATGIHEIMQMTTMDIRRPNHVWAGLRTFSPDGDFIIGPDDQVDNFFWLAGQGGYGIQTAAGASALAMSILLDQPLPESLRREGLTHDTFDIKRLR